MQVSQQNEIQERLVPYVDDDPDGPILVGSLCISMPTALAHILSDDGFVIAADGLNIVRRADGPTIESRCAQKIFHLPGIDREVACAFIGMVTIFNDAGGTAVDFMAEFVSAAQAIGSIPSRDAKELAFQLCQLVHGRVVAVKRDGAFGRYPTPTRPRWGETGHTIVRVYLDGYFGKQPCRTGVRFYHLDQELAWGPIFHDLAPGYKTLLSGSDRVAHLLFDTEDPRLEKYRTDACKLIAFRYKHPDIAVTLHDAIDAGRNYIAACSDPVVMEIDGDTYQPIGGDIHIATITPTDGFQWVSGFSPSAERPSALNL